MQRPKIALIITIVAFAFFGTAFGQTLTLKKPPIRPRDNPGCVIGPVHVQWDPGDRPMVVQAYLHEKLVFPNESPSKTARSGMQIKLAPETYEIKVWVPGTQRNVSTWVEVMEKGSCARSSNPRLKTPGLRP